MEQRKLKVGLALGSGAARGWSHLGVIQALHDMGIHPNVISGCSIGSLVGAAYACGKIEELTDWARGLSSWDIFGLMDFSLNSGGLVAGEKVFNAAEEFISCEEISGLSIPYGCVTTDMETGKELWLTQGNLKDSVSCSCAMPGLMAPKARDGKWLLDGALVNPVPVSLCRALGADVVIAVNLNSDNVRRSVLTTQEEPASESEKTTEKDSGFWRLVGGGKDYINDMASKFKRGEGPGSPGILGVMSTSINIMQDRLTRARMAGDPPEVLLSPKLGDIGIMDFHRADECIAEGYRVTEKMQSHLKEEILDLL